MGESQRANMMGQRVFIIIALMASLCVALPTTDLVVPEAKDAGTTGAKFVQSTLKSGGTETTDFLETQDAATNLLSLHAPAMLDELATLSKEAHTSGQTTAIKQLKHVMVLLEATPNGTATDGGTKKLADRVKTMRDVVQSAIVAMQSGLDSDFTAALADLSTLLNVINSTVRTVETSEQTSIKLKAHNWCIAKEAKDNSTKKCRDATTNVTNFDPAIAVNDAFYKHIGSITDCPAGTALVDGKCPAGVVNLDESTLKAGFQDARDAYHELDVTKTSECGIKTVDEDNEGTNQTAYETTIATILDDHVAACNPDSTVYTTAVTSFNTNNGHRAAMYKSLDKIKCYVNNIDNSADAAACISALSTDYATKYTDHTTAAPTCPTRAVYALQISNYESLSLTESWEPSDVANTCADLAATPTTPVQTGSKWEFVGSITQIGEYACGSIALPCEYPWVGCTYPWTGGFEGIGTNSHWVGQGPMGNQHCIGIAEKYFSEGNKVVAIYRGGDNCNIYLESGTINSSPYWTINSGGGRAAAGVAGRLESGRAPNRNFWTDGVSGHGRPLTGCNGPLESAKLYGGVATLATNQQNWVSGQNPGGQVWRRVDTCEATNPDLCITSAAALASIAVTDGCTNPGGAVTGQPTPGWMSGVCMCCEDDISHIKEATAPPVSPAACECSAGNAAAAAGTCTSSC